MYTPILTELAEAAQPAAAGIIPARPASGCPAQPEAQPAAAAERCHATAVAGPTRATGPRTPEGKATSSRNATKHGLLSTATILTPDESPEDWHEFCRDTCQTLAPGDTLEVAVAVRIAHLHWRAARVPHCEVDAFLAGDDDEGDDPWPDRPFPPARPVAAPAAAAAPALPDSRALARIQRYEAHLARELTRATQYFDDLQAKRIARAAQDPGAAAAAAGPATPSRGRSVSSHPAAAGGSRPQPDVPYVPDCPYAEIHFPDANDALKQALASMRKNCETNSSPGHFTAPRPQAPVPGPDPTQPKALVRCPDTAVSGFGSAPASGFPTHQKNAKRTRRRTHSMARHPRSH